jgi:hypothetical protein
MRREAAALALLADIGGGAIAGAMVAVFGRDLGLSVDDCRFVSGPLIVHQNGWTDIVPKWMASQVIAERVEIVLGDAPGIVGPTEIAAVMMPATFQQPLRYDSHELYLWASVTAVARHTKRPIAEVWSALGHRPIADAEIIERGGRLWHSYQSLADEIRRKVIAHQRLLERNGQAAAPEPAKAELPSLPLLELMARR